jgi:hypothetical protein
MGRLRDRAARGFHEHLVVILFVWLLGVTALGFAFTLDVADRIEREGVERAIENCEESNTTRDLLRDILGGFLVLAEESDDNGRIAVLERSIEAIEDRECPPGPEPGRRFSWFARRSVSGTLILL